MHGSGQFSIRLVLVSILLLVGGCVDSNEFLGFLRTEVARITADVIGQIIHVYYQATT